MAHVYILKTSSGKYYIGSTDDLKRRMVQHRSRIHTHSTKRMGELRLIFAQEYNTLDDARSVERKLKRFKRRDFIEKIIKDSYIKITP